MLWHKWTILDIFSTFLNLILPLILTFCQDTLILLSKQWYTYQQYYCKQWMYMHLQQWHRSVSKIWLWPRSFTPLVFATKTHLLTETRSHCNIFIELTVREALLCHLYFKSFKSRLVPVVFTGCWSYWQPTVYQLSSENILIGCYQYFVSFQRQNRSFTCMVIPLSNIRQSIECTKHLLL